MVEECVFCKIAKEEIPVKKIYENDNFMSFPDANPQVDGHSLVIPKKHFDTTLDMPSSLGGELIDCIKKTAMILMKEKNAKAKGSGAEPKAEGFNILGNNFETAGQLVPHVHFHIFPRKKGDGFNLKG